MQGFQDSSVVSVHKFISDKNVKINTDPKLCITAVSLISQASASVAIKSQHLQVW